MDDRRAYLMRRLFALLKERHVTARGDRLDLFTFIMCRPVGSTDELDDVEVEAVIQAVAGWSRQEIRKAIESVDI